jgi:hypothetical protein
MTELLLQIIAVSVSQMALVFFKHVNIRVIVAKQVVKSMFYTFAIQASWLISSAIGISAFLQHNYIVVVVYLVSGVIGTWLNFKIKV